VAQAVRAAGHEVLIRGAGLPRPLDDAALAAAMAALPGAVGVLDYARGGLSEDEAALAALARAGLGLVSYDAPAAGFDGLPVHLVYRLLDAQDERAPLIGRFLDRATFEAEETGTTVVAGRVRSETVAALRRWLDAGRVDAVTLAPISALLLEGD
jgi:polysaccharide deacetylase 2 family uncharacterized protein YibQ